MADLETNPYVNQCTVTPENSVIESGGYPFCGEYPVGVDLHGPQDIRLTCGHVIDVEAWARALGEATAVDPS